MQTTTSKLLKSKRKETGMTVKEVVDALKSRGISVAEKTVYGWESGNRQPDADVFMVLCDIYNVASFFEEKKPATPASDEAVELSKRITALDKHGKTLVMVVLAEEEKRMTEEQKQRRAKKFDGREVTGESAPRVIPLYLTPPAAGYASPVFGEDFEYIEVGGEVPVHADYAVKIDGDSMEPFIMNGSTVYVNRDPLINGDIGIFYYDGGMYCKQYYKNRWGDVWLLSLNRERADADIHIHPDSETTMAYHGRVIMPFPVKLAVPEKDLKYPPSMGKK